MNSEKIKNAKNILKITAKTPKTTQSAKMFLKPLKIKEL